MRGVDHVVIAIAGGHADGRRIAAHARRDRALGDVFGILRRRDPLALRHTARRRVVRHLVGGVVVPVDVDVVLREVRARSSRSMSRAARCLPRPRSVIVTSQPSTGHAFCAVSFGWVWSVLADVAVAAFVIVAATTGDEHRECNEAREQGTGYPHAQTVSRNSRSRPVSGPVDRPDGFRIAYPTKLDLPR